MEFEPSCIVFGYSALSLMREFLSTFFFFSYLLFHIGDNAILWLGVGNSSILLFVW